MKQCTTCDRHLFGEEPSCPFCGAEQRSTTAIATPGLLAGPMSGPLASMLASVTLALGLCAVACGPGIELETAEASSSSDTSPSPTTTITGTTTTTIGTTTTTTAVTTDDGPVMTTIEPTSADVDSGDDCPGSFYGGCPPDGPPITFECDLFAQDCPPGEKCMPWANDGSESWNATRCSPIADNPGQEDDPCQVEGGPTSGIDDCDHGLMCFHVDPGTNQGTCIPFCLGDESEPTCPSVGQACSITHDGALSLCLDSCDPLMPACTGGLGCHPFSFDSTFVCVHSTSDGVYGDACSLVTDCALGHVCVGQSAFPSCMSPACCTVFCDVTAPETCPEAMLGATCQPWYEAGMAPVGLEASGACALPP